MVLNFILLFFFFSSRRRHTRCGRDWSSDVCSSDLHRRHRAGRRLPGGIGIVLLAPGRSLGSVAVANFVDLPAGRAGAVGDDNSRLIHTLSFPDKKSYAIIFYEDRKSVV